MRVRPFSPTTIHQFYYCYKIIPFLTLTSFLPPSLPPHLSTNRWAHSMDTSPITTTTRSTTITITTTTQRRHHNQRKIVVIMGPTGSGKSRLSIDLATRFFSPSEIINSDKIQLYSGLPITTNKIPMPDRQGVPHHLLGEFDPSDPHHVTPSDFRRIAAFRISDIISRRKLPFIVGGSSSLIHALLTKRFDPDSDVFDGLDPITTELRYNCCFLWVDVSLPVLNQYLSTRVDEMLDLGMFEELSEFFDSGEFDSVNGAGLGKAIGVPEFERYFKTFGCRTTLNNSGATATNLKEEVMYQEAVRTIKDNTCQLAKRQVGKLLRLKDVGWDLRKIDATEAFRAAMMTMPSSDSGGDRVSEIWEKQVVEPSVKIVKRFLEE